MGELEITARFVLKSIEVDGVRATLQADRPGPAPEPAGVTEKYVLMFTTKANNSIWLSDSGLTSAGETRFGMLWTSNRKYARPLSPFDLVMLAAKNGDLAIGLREYTQQLSVHPA